MGLSCPLLIPLIPSVSLQLKSTWWNTIWSCDLYPQSFFKFLNVFLVLCSLKVPSCNVLQGPAWSGLTYVSSFIFHHTLPHSFCSLHINYFSSWLGVLHTLTLLLSLLQLTSTCSLESCLFLKGHVLIVLLQQGRRQWYLSRSIPLTIKSYCTM